MDNLMGIQENKNQLNHMILMKVSRLIELCMANTFKSIKSDFEKVRV